MAKGQHIVLVSRHNQVDLPGYSRSEEKVVLRIRRPANQWHVLKNRCSEPDRRNQSIGFPGIDVLAESRSSEYVPHFVDLSLRRDELEIVAEPGMVQPIRRRAAGYERADEDVRIKDDSHARLPLRRR